MKKMNKVCSLFLVLVLLLGMIPSALAANPFTDVPGDAWYYRYVDSCYMSGYMNGITETEFQPDAKMTRAMLVTVLYRIAGEPSTAGVTPFSDVAADSWFAAPVAWAYENKIVNGTSAVTFSPDANITREDMVTIFHRYAKAQGLDISCSADLTDYTDAARINSWAETAMAWAISKGIIQGVSATELNPLGSATRAECATILNRWMEWADTAFDPYAIYRYPMSEYDAMAVRDAIIEYAETCGMTYTDLLDENNVPVGYNVLVFGSAGTDIDPNADQEAVSQRVLGIVDSALILEKYYGVENLQFCIRYSEDGLGDSYTFYIYSLLPIGTFEEPDGASTEIDIEALEQYGRDYAYATYGYDGNPNCTPDTHAGFYPQVDAVFTTMEEGKRWVRESIDYQYKSDIALGRRIIVCKDDGSIARRHINIEIFEENGCYHIFCYYGGIADPWHQDYWKDPNEDTSSTEPSTEETEPSTEATTHTHTWEFSHYTGAESIDDLPKYEIYICTECGAVEQKDFGSGEP